MMSQDAGDAAKPVESQAGQIDITETRLARQAFDQIYAKDEWGKGSGVGSQPINNLEYATFVRRFMELNHVRTVVDLGCGDWQFSRFIDWQVERYIGLDVSNTVVKQNRARFRTNVIDFEVFTGLDGLPAADLLLCKDVLQHLPNDTVLRYLSAFKAKFKFMLITNDDFPAHLLNQDIPIGGWRTLRLDLEPFCERAAVVLSWIILTDGRALTVRKLTYLFYGETRQDSGL